MSATDFQNARFNFQLPDFPVKNTTGSAMPSGTTVKMDASNVLSGTQQAVGVVPTAAITDVPFGIAVEAIPAGGYGRVQTIEGTAAWAIALGAVTAGAMVGGSATSGQVTTYTAGDPVLGQALTAAVSAADPILVKIAIKGLT
jgi:hypothetical protein